MDSESKMTFLEKLQSIEDLDITIPDSDFERYLVEIITQLVEILTEEAIRRKSWEGAVERELRNLNPGMGDLV